jgi:hypothetical protein
MFGTGTRNSAFNVKVHSFGSQPCRIVPWRSLEQEKLQKCDHDPKHHLASELSVDHDCSIPSGAHR